ncbi:MAG: mechanosensitive ion channel domain-containing protein, partial [Planctomycetota bacterium]
LGPILGKRPGGWVARMAPALNIVIVGVPAALAVLAWMGYFYTASMFERRLEQTALLAIILIFADAMLDRWLFIARRRVAVEDARRRREQQQAEDARGSTDAPTEPSVPLEEETLDLPQMSEQTRQLFNTAIFVAAVVGVLGIWSDVLPALRILDRVQLYPEVRVVEGDDFVPPPSLASATLAVPDRGRAQPAPTPSSEGGAPQAQTGQAQPQPTMMPGAGDLVPTGAASEPERDPPPDTGDGVITLADVLLGLVIALATLLAFRNFPALLEIAVLQRLPLDSGSRFAITTVLRYAIAIIGIVLALGAVGITWSRVQWLAAALTFGLAFGLQEIFANFVSGLIILAERPFRIGDTVTVGTVSGTVSKIRMRATTITDWDRKELIIPNKNFITGDVINWTLSDTVLRVIVPVGVAYGADVRKAEQTLLRVAAEQPLVLDDPKPYVVFNALGDSTLDFELRAFIPHVDHILTVRHDLHMRIVEAFRQEAIEIAFPQRDLHVRSIGELSKLVERRADVGNSER